jgi:hypothetical protein
VWTAEELGGSSVGWRNSSADADVFPPRGPAHSLRRIGVFPPYNWCTSSVRQGTPFIPLHRILDNRHRMLSRFCYTRSTKHQCRILNTLVRDP